MITDELLFRFLNKETSPRENRLIRGWLKGHPDHQARLDKLNTISELPNEFILNEQAETGWPIIESRLTEKVVPINNRSTIPVRLIRIAAVLLVMIASGLFWIHQSNTHVIRNTERFTKSVFLPDGSQVDLGPGAKLVYTKEFLEGVRLIRLTGEAYFDVTSDLEHPFTVIAGSARVKVTGTRFVVNAPQGSDEVEVSVKSGKVLFYNSETMTKNSFRMGLAAGEKGIFYPAMNRMDKTSDPYFRSTP